ncbi:MAG: hypothetical protein RL163_2450 [Pseudomonadota bacterium]|jgi:hypothetical protein
MNADMRPGRSCPVHYHYGPEVFRRPAPAPLSDLEVLYVVGGLYGNEAALIEILRLFEAERGRKRLVFNGDFHWFDVNPQRFARIQQAVLAHTAIRGNVETELADPAPAEDAGCGCAYPDWVGDAVVHRSNRILKRLRSAVTPNQCRALAELPMWLTVEVGGLRVGIVHGDAQSLAGWGFAQEHLRDPSWRVEVSNWLRRADVDAFASSHTCLPVFQRLRLGTDRFSGWILNNGAAGMPNFRGDPAGLITRIATSSCAAGLSRGSVVHKGLFIDALAISVDSDSVCETFLAQWPSGSDAHASYFERIECGPDYHPDQVVRLDD